MSHYAVDDFRVGEVLGQGLRVFKRNFISFAVLAALFYGVIFGMGAGVGALLGDQAFDVNGELKPGPTIFIGVVAFVIVFLFQAALTYGTYQEMRGRRTGVDVCVLGGLRRVFPVIGVVFLSMLAMGFGFLLFIIPGLIVATMLWVAVPVAVVEKPGVLESLTRSRKLTEGYRWPIFGIIVLISLLESGANQILIVAADPASMHYAIIEAIVSMFFLIFQSVMPAVGYFHLRNVKEGVGLDELAAVFD